MRYALAAAHDQGAAVNPDDDGTDLLIVGTIDVCLDLEVADSLIGVSLHFDLTGCGIGLEAQKDNTTSRSKNDSFKCAFSHRFALH